MLYQAKKYNADQRRGVNLSGFVLKMIAVITMLIDHIGAVLFPFNPLFRYIGRIAFPIFAFLIAEGFYYTKSRVKYAARLFVFALLSEIPFDLAFSNKLLEFSSQNVYFSLLLGLCAIWIIQWLKDKNKHMIILSPVIAAIFAYIANSLNCDYGWFAVALITVFYLFRGNDILVVVGFVLLIAIYIIIPGNSLIMLFELCALLPIVMYNGERGYNSRAIKLGFYAFYPIHLLVLYAISLL